MQFSDDIKFHKVLNTVRSTYVLHTLNHSLTKVTEDFQIFLIFYLLFWPADS